MRKKNLFKFNNINLIILSTAFFILFFQSLSIAQNEKNKVKIAFRIDDYGLDNAKFYDKLIDIIEKTNCKISLGVVPFKKSGCLYQPISDSLIDLLKGYLQRYSGVEIAQHGFAHENILLNGGSS